MNIFLLWVFFFCILNTELAHPLGPNTAQSHQVNSPPLAHLDPEHHNHHKL